MKRAMKLLCHSILSSALAVSLLCGGVLVSGAIGTQKAARFEPQQLVVGVKADQDSPGIAAAFAQGVGTVMDYLPQIHVYQIQVRAGLTVDQARQQLLARPEVRFAEPNAVAEVADAKPNDTSYALQYAPQIVGMEQAWPKWNPKAPIVLAIIDTGCDPKHPDLVNKYYRDDSGNIIGYNTKAGNPDFSDKYGHGTHCAGIAIAQINNGTGIAGIAGWNGDATQSDTAYSLLMPVKCLGDFGDGNDMDIARGITWAADHGAWVLSMSLRIPGGALAPASEMAINYAYGLGCLTVEAAGNESSNYKNYPSAYPHVLSVAATDSRDQMASFSQWGDWVWTAAPGVHVYSTLPTTGSSLGSNYGYLDGTSMACPCVAGEAVFLWAQYPDLFSDDLFGIIVSNTDPYTGRPINGGRINVNKAIDVIGP